MSKRILFILLFSCILQIVFSQTVVENYDNELQLTMDYNSETIYLEFENTSSSPIAFSWENVTIRSERGQYIYEFPPKTEIIMPEKTITRRTPGIDILNAEVLDFQYKIKFTEKKKSVNLLETKLFYSNDDQNTAGITPIKDTIQRPDLFAYEWEEVSSIRVPNGWMEKDSQGRILSVGGFNSGLGVSFKQYFSPVIANSWNGFWEYGVVSLIVPYIEVGSDYVWDSGWYVGLSLNLPFVVGINVGRYF